MILYAYAAIRSDIWIMQAIPSILQQKACPIQTTTWPMAKGVMLADDRIKCEALLWEKRMYFNVGAPVN